MTQDARRQFEFPSSVPVDGVGPGTNIMVGGPSGSGARDVALQLVAATRSDEGTLLVSADVGGRALLERTDDVLGQVDRSRLALVDSAGFGDDQRRFAEHAESIDDPGDLMAIQMELSVLYETLVERGLDRIRTGVFSVSSLLAHADLREVSRFVHMLTGRVIATEDLGVFVVDSAMQDDRTIDAIEQFCDLTVDVRDGDGDGLELRVRGHDASPEAWTAFTPSWA